jgi:hypothetical protein
LDAERYQPKAIRILVASIAMVGAASLFGAIMLYPADLGTRQPISFSHRVHAGKKEISCLMCHPHVTTRAVAGIPPLETCMLCHSRIAVHYPEIEKVRAHFDQNEPVLWNRVAYIPDLVHFNHGVHLTAGVDCSRCHGDVKAMDRIVLHRKFIMGFCIQCHRENNASQDCFTCHY